MRSQRHPRIVTKDRNGEENGVLVPIYNIHDNFVQGAVQQVYLTTLEPGCRKGPHLHKKRTGYFTCIQGNIMIVTQVDAETYLIDFSGDLFGNATVEIPPNTPTLIINMSHGTSLVINTTFPAWTPEDPDDDPVVGWTWDAKNNVGE